MKTLIIGGLWLSILLAGCGATPRGETLMDAVRTYNDGVRWERFTAAAGRVPSRERDQFLDEREELAEDLRISDYEVVRVKDKGESADVQVKLTWYKDSEGTVRETWARQAWERHGKAWRIVEESRVRGAEMPGLE
ncbi:MAG TPA: hypothetical protein VM261_21925 [Kofleriaceae bacterium]|nr:hypothetical protein [Kofleriaceae bacterium]